MNLIVIPIVAVLLYYIFAPHKNAWTALYWKTASSIGFLITGWILSFYCKDSHYVTWMYGGLCLGAIGDVLLALPFCYPAKKEGFFLGGLSAFLLGHLCYIIALFQGDVKSAWPMMIPAAMLAWGLIKLLPRLGVDFEKMQVPSMVYALVILCMEACALSYLPLKTMYAFILNLAALAFVLSDLVLVFILFGKRDTRSMTMLNLSLYYGAQMALCATFLFR